MKANDQLRQWFEDDEALERAINGEYVFDQICMSIIPYIFLTTNVDHITFCPSLLFQLGGFYYRMEMEQVF